MSDFLIGSIIIAATNVVVVIWSNRSFQRFYASLDRVVENERRAHRKTIDNFSREYQAYQLGIDHRLHQLESPKATPSTPTENVERT